MKKLSRSPVVTGLMFMLAVVLLFAGTVGGTQAALQVYSSNYLSALNLDHIGVTLKENSNPVAWRNYGTTAASGFEDRQLDGELVADNLGTDQELHVGKNYNFVITAQNTGTIDQFVRVTIYKYWVSPETPQLKGWIHGDKSTKIKDINYDPDLIKPTYLGRDYNSDNWVVDDGAHTAERDVYYYKGILKAGSPDTEPLFTHLRIDSSVASLAAVTKTQDGKTVYTYAYDGLGFIIKAEVDAVQTHNAEKAVRSIWGLTDANIMSQMGIPVSN